MANINQYLIMSSAPEAPDFANGLFISSCNFGTTLGSAAGGLLITEMGIQYIGLAGILSLLFGLAAISIRNHVMLPRQQFSRS